jgi:hypothetical protein
VKKLDIDLEKGRKYAWKQLCDFLGQAHKWDMTSRLYWFIPVYKYTEYFKATLNGKEN